MSPWAKLDDRFHGHPKLLGLGLAATGLFARGLAYAAGYSTDGFLPDQWVRGQLSTAEERKLPDRLVGAGLWERIEGGFQICNYLAFNPSKAEWAEYRKLKSEAGRKGAASRWHDKGDGSRHGKPIAEPEPEARTHTTARPGDTVR